MNEYNTDIRSVVVGLMSRTTIKMLAGDGRVVRVQKRASPDRRAKLFQQVFSGQPQTVSMTGI